MLEVELLMQRYGDPYHHARSQWQFGKEAGRSTTISFHDGTNSICAQYAIREEFRACTAARYVGLIVQEYDMGS